MTASRFQVAIEQLLGIGLLVVALVLIYVVIAIWPQTLGPSANDVATSGTWVQSSPVFGFNVYLDPDRRMMLIVAIVGALGSFVQIATSFSTYLGNRAFVISWVWWYILRVPVGVALALILYIVARAGLLTNITPQSVNVFGFAALAALAGMFSNSAIDKLHDVFETVFQSSTNASRSNKLNNPVPVISAVVPPVIVPGTTQIELSGTGFVEDTVVSIDGSQRQTRFVDATHVTVRLASTDLGTDGATLTLVATNPPQGGGGGDSAPITVKVQLH